MWSRINLTIEIRVVGYIKYKLFSLGIFGEYIIYIRDVDCKFYYEYISILD